MSNQTVQIDPIRSLAYTSIITSYVAVGSALTNPARIVCFTNASDGDLFVSTDGSNNMLFLAAGTFKLFDLTANRTINGFQWVFPIGTQFYTKYSTLPTKSALYIECLWGV